MVSSNLYFAVFIINKVGRQMILKALYNVSHQLLKRFWSNFIRSNLLDYAYSFVTHTPPKSEFVCCRSALHIIPIAAMNFAGKICS